MPFRNTQSKKNSAAPCYQVPGLPDGVCSTARPQLTAFFTSSPILASSAAVNSYSANLDEGALWPTAFALKELTATEEARIGALVKKAVS